MNMVLIYRLVMDSLLDSTLKGRLTLWVRRAALFRGALDPLVGLNCYTHDLFSIGRLLILEFPKLGRHRGITPSQLLDRYVLRLVVCKTKVPIRAK